MAGRKAAHTYTGRALTGSSDVTSESKTDTNAGSTAASGFGNPVHDSVSHVEVTVASAMMSDQRERISATER
jgi:hypothetical protein